MANSYNKIILVGNLGRDGEMRATPQGKQVLSTSLAVEDPSKKDDRDGPARSGTASRSGDARQRPSRPTC